MRNGLRRVAFAGDFMTDGQMASLHLSDFGGTFISESGNRGEKGVMATLAYIPEVADEETRVVKNDRLRRFVQADNIANELEAYTDYVINQDGDIETFSVDPAIGPKFERYKGTVDEALAELLRRSPKYVLEAYKMSEKTGRLDILNRLPGIVAGLVQEGVYTLEVFRQTSIGNGFSVYRTLKGHASTERTVIGPEGGIACQILEVLRAS